MPLLDMKAEGSIIPLISLIWRKAKGCQLSFSLLLQAHGVRDNYTSSRFVRSRGRHTFQFILPKLAYAGNHPEFKLSINSGEKKREREKSRIHDFLVIATGGICTFFLQFSSVPFWCFCFAI